MVRIIQMGEDRPVGIHTELRQRGWRQGELPVCPWRDAQGQTEQQLEGATMGDETHRMLRMRGENRGVSRLHACSDLEQRLSARWRTMQRVVFPRRQGCGVALLQFSVRIPLPGPKADFPEPWLGLHPHALRGGNCLGSLPSTLQITGIECLQGLCPETLREGGHLTAASRVEGHVCLPLKASLRRPIGSAMAY